MSNKDVITCHKGARFAENTDNWKLEWTEKQHGQHPDPCDHCSYCGSIHFDDVRRIIDEGGRLGGSDWKYGFPHKFYAYEKNSSNMHKFYAAHLIDLPKEEFGDFATLLEEQTGIKFFYDENYILMYEAPYHGYQR